MRMKFAGVIFLLLATTTCALAADESPPTPLWHTKTLSFLGPQTSEGAAVNPFTDYRLTVTFECGEARDVVRGFYAADGNAAETGATAGRVWQVRFAPDRTGTWTYSASLRQGENIAINDDPLAGTDVPLEQPTGRFDVVPISDDADKRDFRNRGRLIADGGYFRFGDDGDYWLKAGANSPENLLAFADFDQTYRQQAAARDGEAAPPDTLHRYAAHVDDWQEGDPTWRGGRGKGLIGALNYLASAGMNAVYFLSLNIGGDGNDVWPFAAPDEFTRFDCSKLDQWEIVFDHMQRRGLLIHMVTQETENERLLDDGDVGPLRKLYYRELIARFAHHPALVWNLGEENGPADFSPNGQTSAQQKAMADYLRAHDPYGHPIQIHTHSTAKSKDELLPALLGHQSLDGLSFQVNQREQVHGEVIKWRQRSRDAGHEWLITMDEIGKWDTGALTDAQDPTHDSLRRYVLWGSLMAGAAGVEWYFGAHHPHNDLNSEDWRQRANLWKQSHLAASFFEQHLPYWEMQPADELTSRTDDYCFASPGSVYVLFVPGNSGAEPLPRTLDLESNRKPFRVRWFDPLQGGPLRNGTVETITGPGPQLLGAPPANPSQDWVVLVTADKDGQ